MELGLRGTNRKCIIAVIILHEQSHRAKTTTKCPEVLPSRYPEVILP